MLDSFEDWIHRLEQALRQTLPGTRAQLRVAPRPRYGKYLDLDPAGARKAAVVALLHPGLVHFRNSSSDRLGLAAIAPPKFEAVPSGVKAVPSGIEPGPSGMRLVFTRRSEGLSNHKGQICWPGGAVEDGEPPERAALRELHEEIGVDPQDVRIVGALSPLLVTVSGFCVYPFVAVSDSRPPFRILEHEVAEILEPRLEHLLRPEALQHTTREIQGRTIEVPYYDLEGHELWGATAMMLSELLEVVRRMRSEV